MATSPTPLIQAVAKRNVFDLETFERKTIEVPYVVPGDLTDVTSLVDIDPKDLLTYVNIGRKRAAWANARASIQGASTELVNSFTAGFRFLPQFAGIKNRADQTKAILSFVRTIPELFEGLKAAALADQDKGEDDSSSSSSEE